MNKKFLTSVVVEEEKRIRGLVQIICQHLGELQGNYFSQVNKEKCYEEKSS